MRKLSFFILFFGYVVGIQAQAYKPFATVINTSTGETTTSAGITNIPRLRGCLNPNVAISVSGFGQTIAGFTETPQFITASCTGFNFQWGDGTTTPTNVATKTYVSAGMFTLTVNASCNNNARSLKDSYVNIDVFSTPPPAFTLSGCTALTANVLIDKVYDLYDINWGDASANTTVSGGISSHTFGSAGIKNISIRGIYTNTGTQLCQNTASKQIQVYPPFTQPAVSEVEVLNSGNMVVQINTSNQLKYKVEVKPFGGNFSEVLTISSTSGTNSYTFSGSNALSSPNIIQTYAFDDCGNKSNADDISSTFITSTADVTANTATWNEYVRTGGNVDYVLNRDGNQIFAQSKNATVDVLNLLPYKDTDVQCGQRYCYNVVARTPSKTSISASSCVVAQKPVTISGVRGFNSTFENNGTISLLWEPSTASGVSYIITGSDNAGFSTQLKETTLLGLSGINKSYTCFTIKPRLSCSPENPPVKTCPIKISGGTVGSGPTSIENQLFWTNYVNGNNESIVSQEIEWFSESNTPLGSASPTGLQYVHSTIDELNQKVLYRIRATLPNGIIVYSDVKDIIQFVRLWVPTAFNPNGANSIFFPKGLFWKDFDMSIFNRWGERVYHTTDATKGWDGGTASPGLYSFSITVNDFYGKSLSQSGTFSMIR
ncbi:MAG: hypothetical protein EAZ53_12975 [Bacteroidetes bacterium]|nr:MAG: hypothetical protein EAZ53_12975 [Bacteroidota bacterium]